MTALSRLTRLLLSPRRLLAFWHLSTLMPGWGRWKQEKSLIRTAYAISRGLAVSRGFPIHSRIAPISQCNYHCLFCEIHKDDLMYPDRARNEFTFADMRNYEVFLSAGFSLDFYGGAEEPLLCRDLGAIVRHLKKCYGLKMMANTNASIMKPQFIDDLVDSGFDEFLVSYHAGTPEGYRFLMTGSVEKVNRNLELLQQKKREKGVERPTISFNFAPHRLNAGEYEAVIRNVKRLDGAGIFLSRYYGGRNRLDSDSVSFDAQPEEGNRLLKRIYDFAAAEGVPMSPPNPPYWTLEEAEPVHWDEENLDRAFICHEPWLKLHFNPNPRETDCHNVGVCNRVELFALHYRKVRLTEREFFKLWNHPLLQYLRETVNSEGLNPICRFCKNRDRDRIRNLDMKSYARIRDRAVVDFFAEYRSRGVHVELDWLEVFSDNPNSDDHFTEFVPQWSANLVKAGEGPGGAT